MLQLKNVNKQFGPRQILESVNLDVREGEFVSIVGYSGSGKTTLVNIAAGLIEASSGEVRRNTTRTSVVFQNYSLLPWFSAIENVRLAVEAAFPTWEKQKQRSHAARYLEMVGLGNAFEKRPSQLSGGMRQRVSIARAFAMEPELLFLDEPFGALDALTRANLQLELSRMCSSADRTLTTLMITNSVEEAILLSDRIVPLSRGPKATLRPAVDVTLPRPRTPDTLAHSDETVRIQARVIDSLKNMNVPSAVLEVAV